MAGEYVPRDTVAGDRVREGGDIDGKGMEDRGVVPGDQVGVSVAPTRRMAGGSRDELEEVEGQSRLVSVPMLLET